MSALQRTTDPLGVMIVRVLVPVCASCERPSHEHRATSCRWQHGGLRFVPDRRVPLPLQRALPH